MTTWSNDMRIKWRKRSSFPSSDMAAIRRCSTFLLEGQSPFELSFSLYILYTTYQTSFASDDRWPWLRTIIRPGREHTNLDYSGNELAWIKNYICYRAPLIISFFFSLAPLWDMSVAQHRHASRCFLIMKLKVSLKSNCALSAKSRKLTRRSS